MQNQIKYLYYVYYVYKIIEIWGRPTVDYLFLNVSFIAFVYLKLKIHIVIQIIQEYWPSSVQTK